MTFEQVIYQPLTSSEFRHFYPFLPHSLHIDLTPSYEAWGAYKNRQPVGIVLTKIKPPHAEILFLFVQEKERNRGIGKKLMKRVEDTIGKKGCETLTLFYMTKRSSHPIITHILNTSGWIIERPHMQFYEYDLTHKQTQEILTRFSKIVLPPHLQIVPFDAMTSAERIFLKTTPSFYPSQLNPFQEEELIEPLNSLWLRAHDQIVGWMITHRIHFDTIRYTSLFVTPEMEKKRMAIPLFLEAILRQWHYRTTIPFGVQAIPLGFESMLRFAKKKMAPISIQTYASYVAVLKVSDLEKNRLLLEKEREAYSQPNGMCSQNRQDKG